MTADGRVMREDQAPAAIRAEVNTRHRASIEAARGLRDTLSRRLRSNTMHGIVRLPDGTTQRVVFHGGGDGTPAEGAAPPVLPQREDGEPRRHPLTELFQMTAGMPNPVVEVGRNDDFLTEGSATWVKLRDGTVIECPGPGPRVAPYEAARILVGLLYERVRKMQPAQGTVALGVDSQDVKQAQGMADALRRCQQELRDGVTATLTRPTSDPLAFFDAVGAAMGLDPREVREAQPAPQDRTFAVSARNLRARLGEVPGHGQYVLVPSTPIKVFLARQLRVGPTD